MKTSVRTKFALVILFFFLVITALSVLSAYHFNKLSLKTNAILKENQYSVICAREMAGQLTTIGYSVNDKFLHPDLKPDAIIPKSIGDFKVALSNEKLNITEPGEEKLVAEIEQLFNTYADSLRRYSSTSQNINQFDNLQNQSIAIHQKLMLLSQINEKAIENKTFEAKAWAQKALWQVSLTATLGFLIAMSFAFNFASYFHSRFSELYKGLKKMSYSDYSERIYFDGNDEFVEISQIFNEMAEKLTLQQQKTAEIEPLKREHEEIEPTVEELKLALENMRRIEKQVSDLMQRLDKKN
jgi:two-component system, NtrC family, sensor histidine kinase KinB